MEELRRDLSEADVREAFVEPIDQVRQRTGGVIHTTDYETLCFKPVPTGLVYQCRLSRIQKFQSQFDLFLEDSVGGERYLLSASRKIGSVKYTIYYKNPITEQEQVIGCVKSNVIGTTFSVYDCRGEDEEEVAYVAYEPNMTGPKQPRKIRLIIPSMNMNGERNPVPRNKRMVDIVRQGNETRQFIELKNKQPEWSALSNAFVLNFAGRVLESSIKNFQIIHEHDLDYITLQFGKVHENLFNLDARYPFSLFQAFGIVLTSFDTKITSE